MTRHGPVQAGRRRLPSHDDTLSSAARESLQGFKAEVFKALSHPTRIKILELLRHNDMSVTELGESLGLDISNVSQHITVLRHKNILQGRKDGLTVYYQVRSRRLYKVLDLFRDWFLEHVQDQRDRFDVLELS